MIFSPLALKVMLLTSCTLSSSEIPEIKWRCSPVAACQGSVLIIPLVSNCSYSIELLVLQFILDLTWQVVGGEESKEVEVQNQRQMRVLEAVYPRTSAIPQKLDTIIILLDLLLFSTSGPKKFLLSMQLYFLRRLGRLSTQ